MPSRRYEPIDESAVRPDCLNVVLHCEHLLYGIRLGFEGGLPRIHARRPMQTLTYCQTFMDFRRLRQYTCLVTQRYWSTFLRFGARIDPLELE